jgi:polyferredoxin/Flp pilus assembly protein TadD
MPLPVIQPKTRIRASRSTRWRAGVLIAVHLLVAAHITHWLITGRSITPVEPSEAAAFARAGVINAGLIFFLATIALTAIFGRFFCGWGCHLVALQDLARGLFEKFGHRPKPLRSRLLAWVPAAAFAYAFLWPAFYRWRAGASLGPTATEFTTSEFWATFPGWGIGILTFMVCGFVAVYFLGAKGFCTYACPYGAAFGVAERLAPLRIRVTDACEGCGHCTAVCTSNVRVHEEVRDFGMVVDSGCMKCLDCVSVCPNDALYYGAGPLPIGAARRASGPTMSRYPLSWAEEGVLGVVFIVGFLVFRGLYGYVPLLMALGGAGVLAYLALLTYQLAARPHLALKSWQLKRGGRIGPAGAAFLALMALVFAFTLHSGAVRYFIARGDAGGGVLARWQGPTFDLAAARPVLTASERALVAESHAAYAMARRIGWIDTLGAAPLMATMEYLLGDDETAERQARAAIAKGELAGRMEQLLGRLAFDRGELAPAARHFEAAIGADPYDPRPHTSLGITLAQQGDLAGARRVFEGAVDAFGASAALDYNLGLVAAYDGRLEEAAGHFRAALTLDPEHLPARENLAGTLGALGRFAASAEQYAEALRRSPADPVTHLLLARVLIDSGRLDEAATQIEAALQLRPGWSEAVALGRRLAEVRAAPPPRDRDGL